LIVLRDFYDLFENQRNFIQDIRQKKN